MEICSVPDANIRSMVSAVTSVRPPGRDPEARTLLQLLQRDVQDCVDPRCPDHLGRHRVRKGHLEQIVERAERLIPHLRRGRLDHYHADLVVAHARWAAANCSLDLVV